MHRFKIGDVVQLNSGGPELTVIGHEQTKVFCLCGAAPAMFQSILVPELALTLIRLNLFTVN